MKLNEIEKIAKKYIIADGERMARRPKGHCKLAWRAGNPISCDPRWEQGRYLLTAGEPNGCWFDAWIWDLKSHNVAVRFDLRAEDAQNTLDKYFD